MMRIVLVNQYLHRSISQSLPLLAAACLSLFVNHGYSHDAREIDELKRKLEESRQQINDLIKQVTELENELNEVSPHQEEDTDMQLSDMEGRLNDVEGQIYQLDDHKVRVFDAISLDIGGFVSQVVTAVASDEHTDVSANQTLFELLIRANLTEDWSLFSALGFLRESDLDFNFPDPRRPRFRKFENRTEQIISWANYNHTDALKIQIGRFVTPHGIVNIEHFPPVLLDLNQPMFLRPFSGNSLFPNFVNGAQVYGSLFPGDSEFEYNVYGGVFSGGEATDPVAGARLAYRIGDSGFRLGLNYHHGRRDASGESSDPTSPPFFTPGHFSIVPEDSLTSNSYDTAGFDVLYSRGRVLWKNEIFYSFEYSEDNRLAFYTQPALKVSDKWILFYRFDYFDPGQNLDDSIENIVGVNFLPTPTIRLRTEFINKRFDESLIGDYDLNILQFSATVSF